MFHHVVTIDSGSRTKFIMFVALTVALTTAAWAHIRLGDSALHQIVFRHNGRHSWLSISQAVGSFDFRQAHAFEATALTTDGKSWHILTAIGVYIAMIAGEFFHEGNRTQILGPEDGYLKILRVPSL
ncbi:hypothetical protein ACJ73_01896 [Blastomyces percursus]|uniref:Uncharacterized protein n=1 Tax=Blastomyces percursus TaxID=1658174 RepID=A0A1J9R2S3_9EURO|nr:hypothetical protein ACJ73_01896 [Blastomyces percursus]